MARGPVPGRVKRRLEPMLGPDGCARLHAVLVRRTLATAAALGRVVVACEGAVEVPPGADRVAQSDGDPGERMRTAAGWAFERHGGPLLVVGTDVPRLGEGHVAAALADLATGADASFGPTLGGGAYLTALPAPRPEVFGLGAGEWGGPAVLGRMLERAGAAGLEIGMLHMERDLGTPEDARAMLADPLLPADVRAALADRGT